MNHSISSTRHGHSGAYANGRPLSHKEQLKGAAHKLIAQTFFGPMLKQMRNSPFKSKVFSGGRGGEAFSGMLDQHLAEHMSHAKSTDKLADSIVKKWMRKEKDPDPAPAGAGDRVTQARMKHGTYRPAPKPTPTPAQWRQNVQADLRA